MTSPDPSSNADGAGTLPTAGQFALISHWRGPIVKIEKVTSKRITLVGGGYCDPHDIRALFATEQEAEDGLRRYRAAWSAAQPELAVYAAAQKEDIHAFAAAERRLKMAAWGAATPSSKDSQ